MDAFIAERRALIRVMHEMRVEAAAMRNHAAVREYTQQAVLARYDIARYSWLSSADAERCTIGAAAREESSEDWP